MADVLSVPTQSELYSVSNLRPILPPPPPNAPALLQLAINLCGEKWISDFLLTSDPIHVPQFTSSDMESRAVLTHVSRTRVGLEEQMHSGASFLFLPAFSAAGCTFGFGVMRGVERRGALLDKRLPLVMPFRFLKNLATKELLMVHESELYDCVMLYYSRQIDCVTDHTFAAQLGRRKLLATLKQNGGIVDGEGLMGALGYITNEKKRSRNGCDKCAGEGCNTEMELDVRHPFDFEPFKTSISRGAGVYEGLATKRVGMRGISQGVRVRMATVHNLTEIKEMRNWVVRHAYTSSVSPMENLLLVDDTCHDDLQDDAVAELIKAVGSPVSQTEQCDELINVVPIDWTTRAESRDMFGSSDVTKELEHLVDKKKKLEKRKERNRKSAKESNARNKLRRQNMSKELEELKERATQLRDYEMKLRRENVQLKRLRDSVDTTDLRL